MSCNDIHSFETFMESECGKIAKKILAQNSSIFCLKNT
jgi:hypothetical protein